jgi:hypothetical protein
MDTQALLDQFRLETRDQVHPYLWSDEEILLYLDEAQKMYCRLTGGIADATSSAAARMKVTAGKRYASLSPLVLKLRAAFGEDGRTLEIVNFEQLELNGSEGVQLFTDQPGPVCRLVVGMEPNKVRVVNTPTEDQTINLIVYRLPLDALNALGLEPEIDEQHHLALLTWARHLAHLKPDAETYDRGRAQQYEQEFVTYCSLAKDEKGKREHTHRLMQFSW